MTEGAISQWKTEGIPRHARKAVEDIAEGTARALHDDWASQVAKELRMLTPTKSQRAQILRMAVRFVKIVQLDSRQLVTLEEILLGIEARIELRRMRQPASEQTTSGQ